MALRSKDPWIQYVPVDISDGLLQMAVKILSNYVRVPMGIIGDFEDRMDFINRQLDSYAPTPVLYSLLGATVGNFENKFQFFAGMNNIMKPMDRLLIDISLAGKEWVQEKDRRGNTGNLGKKYKRFFAQGMARAEPVSPPTRSIRKSIKARYAPLGQLSEMVRGSRLPGA
jgi:hypothetical protein